MLGEGYFQENLMISGTGGGTDVNQYSLDSLNFTHEISKNQIIYRTILRGNQNVSEVNVASLTVTYRFYPDMVQREYLISNDWPGTGSSPQKSMTLSTNLFTGMSDFVIMNDQGLVRRHIYESEDASAINDKITNLYVHEGNEGIFIKYGSTAPYPTSLIYKGSTVYNMSSISVSQSNRINSGASFHIIQYLSVGDEYSAEQNILNHADIVLTNYPMGTIPFVITGYRTPMIDLMEMGNIRQGYDIIRENGISYSEVVVPTVQADDSNATLSSTTDSGQVTNVLQDQNLQQLPSINLEEISASGIPIIGALSTGTRHIDDYYTQEKNIASLYEYAKGQDVKLTGFMPMSLIYNQDTLKILREHQTPFVLAIPVNPPVKGFYDRGFRNPEIAYYHNESTGMVLLPVSYPMSSSLLLQPDPEDVFSSWKTIIDQAAKNDEMVLFVWRANDIGNPDYTDEFVNLTAYAREKGLTFTTPAALSDHYLKLQNIEYEGTIKNDMATIQVHNKNGETATEVTFKVLLPVLKTGDYNVENARIVREIRKDDNEWIYITTDLPGYSRTNLVITPESARENLSVEVPSQLIEGPITLVVRTPEGTGLKNVDVSVDLDHYKTDKDGEVRFEVRRGIHTATIQSPGYNPVTLNLDVKGRIFFLSNLPQI